MKLKFEKNVEFLKRNVPPDDIYIFAEQTFMAAMFFMHKWTEWVELTDEAQKDPVVNKWVKNILGFQMFKDNDIDVQLDLDLKSIEPNEIDN